MALVGTQVAITTTDGMIDGNWLLDSFEASRDNPYPNWDYNMSSGEGERKHSLWLNGKSSGTILTLIFGFP